MFIVVAVVEYGELKNLIIKKGKLVVAHFVKWLILK